MLLVAATIARAEDWASPLRWTELVAEPPAPPPLLSPDTPPSPALPVLVPPPVITVRAPVPRLGAANCVRRDQQGRFMGWMDYQHCVFSGRTVATARWFDDLFGDWHDDQASMLLRVIAQTAMVEGDGLDARLSVRASAALPNARQRLRLIVSDEQDDPAFANQDVRRRLREEDTRTSAALRWITLEHFGVESDFDLGVRGIDPPDVFARARARRSWSLSRDSIVRFSQNLRYGSDSKERYVSLLELERALSDRSVLRLSTAYDYAADFAEEDGFRWSKGVSISRALSHARSLSYGVSVNGQTRPGWRADSFGPWAVYRRSFLRPWLFYEVEPHYTFYREREWNPLASIVLRLEVQFGFKELPLGRIGKD